MARPTNKLTAIVVEKQRRPGRHSDGGGLYLNITKSGSKSWVFIWSNNHRKREMGLGPYPAVSLAKARARSERCREQVADGLDPIVERGRDAQKTFGECADACFQAMKGQWSHNKTQKIWHRAINHYCEPIRPRPIAAINTEDVLQVLNPIWQTKSETASKLRGRIERVLDFAKAKGWRTGENSARWRGHLENILPKPQKLTRGHFPAMDYRDVPVFFERLQNTGGMAARALQFLILTAARSGEVLGARWPEMDLEAGIWAVPAGRMKGRIEHRVPL
ncbi:MAG: integrase arm-type DNA-binding domain-containing protein, partial [Burkholderiales bacterium]|nr:integrase arm-type DNA-binding domain-containing protein [Burkholderiales bacterium]